MDAGFFLVALVAMLPALLLLGGDDDGDDPLPDVAGDAGDDRDGAANDATNSDPPQDHVATPAEGDLFFPEFRPGVDRLSIRLGAGEAETEISVDGAGRPTLSVTGAAGSMTTTFAGLTSVPEEDVWFELDDPDGPPTRLSLADVIASPSGPLAPTDPDAPDALPDPTPITGLAPTDGEASDPLPGAPSVGPGLAPIDPDAPDLLDEIKEALRPEPEAAAPDPAGDEALAPEAGEVAPDTSAGGAGAEDDLPDPDVLRDDPPSDEQTATEERPQEEPDEGRGEATAEDAADDLPETVPDAAPPSVVRVTTDPDAAHQPLRLFGVTYIHDFDVDRDILYIQLDDEWTEGPPPVKLTESWWDSVLVRFDGKLVAVLRNGSGIDLDDVVVTR